MATVRVKSSDGKAGAGLYVDATFLPRCASCHSPHPLARKPPIQSSTCPDCGCNVGVSFTRHSPAALSSFHPLALIARFCLWIGSILNSLAGRI